jgi:hypothetical protein
MWRCHKRVTTVARRPFRAPLQCIVVAMTGPVRVGLMAALAMWLVSGCGPNTDPDTTVEHSGGIYLLKETQSYTGDVGGYGIRGRLTLLEETCIGYRWHGRETVIVFPPSARLSGGGRPDVTIKVEGMVFHLGDGFEAGTRGGAGSRASDYGDLADQAPQECQDLPALAVDSFGRTS